MSVAYGVVDALERTNVPTHLETLERLDALHSVLAMDGRGYETSAPVYDLPWHADKARFVTPTLTNNAADWYLSRYVSEDADALMGWSGMSSRTIETANRAGLTTFVFRASPHILTAKQALEHEYERFDVSGGIGTLNAWKECFEYQEADYVVTVSEYCRSSFAEWGIDTGKVLVVPYDVDTALYRSVENRSEPGTFTVCTATTIDLLRGIPYLLEAWREFAKGKDDVELLLAGERSSDFPDDLYEEFEARPDVTFLGYIDDVPDLYARSDVFALASLADGGPVGPFEAMAAGIPVVVSDHMGARDDVTDGESGFVVPRMDGEAIREKLELLYRNPDRRREMGARAAEEAKGQDGRQSESLAGLYREYVAD